MNPLSQQMQAQGRGNDSVLVHMSPREVGGLQALAQSYGGTLTRNPTTGLPEAGFLDSILPMLAGAAGGAMGIDPWMAAAGAGLVQGAITGNLEKGLTAGLSAYGGASLGRTLNPEGTFAGYQIGTKPSLANIDPGAAHGDVASSLTPAEATTSHSGFLPDGNVGSDSFAEWTAGSAITPTVAPTIPLNTPTPPAPQSMFDKFNAAANAGIANPNIAKFAPYAAYAGLAAPFLGTDNSGMSAIKAPEARKLAPPKQWNREIRYPSNQDLRNSSEFAYFTPSNPYPTSPTAKPEPEINLDMLAKLLGASTIRMAEGGSVPAVARPRYAPDVAVPAGYAAQAPARVSAEQLYSFPKATNIPKLSKIAASTPEVAALQKQYPTATKAQVSELDRMIQAGGDPGANLSLMQAYSPAGSIKELQPWAKEYKGDSYRDSHPVDAFGNPIGWSLPAQTTPTTDANGVPSGWDPRDWANFQENYNPGMPDPEYIINNPWNYGTQALGVGDFLVSPSASIGGYRSGASGTGERRTTGYTGSGNEGKAYRDNLTKYNERLGAANNAVTSDMEQMYSPEGLSNLYPGDPEQMYSPDNVGALSNRIPAYLANPQSASSGSSTFYNALSNVMPSLSGATDYVGRQFSGAAPRPATGSDSSRPGFFANPVEYLGNKVSDVYNDLGNIGNWTTGEFVNAGLNFLPTGIPGVVGGMLAGGIGVPLPEGHSYVTSPPLSYQFGQEIRDFIQNLGKPKGQAAGGVNLEDGSFVVDARTVAELGNGSSGAGQEVLARLGGRPIHGPGDGVSDSIRANIGGTQEARVARDEVKFDPEAVKRLGHGNPKKGADRLYDMMKKAEKARKSASRGKDTGLRALAGAR